MVQSQTAAIAIASIKIVIYFFFLVIYIVRVRKLDKLASNNFLEEDRILAVKIAMIILLIILSMIHIILSEVDMSYWMYQYRNYSLVDILGIFDYSLQLYIINRQHKKKARKSTSVLSLWILNSLITFITIILVEIYQPSLGIILLIFKCVSLLVLIILTLALDKNVKPTQIDQLRQTINQSNLLPVNGNDTQRNNSISLYVEFNKQFQITMKEDSLQCAFKIAVYIGEESFIITKNQDDFRELSKDLMKLFPENHDVVLKIPLRTNSTNMMKYGEEKQKLYESYLIEITRSNKYYVEPLMMFLNIAPVKRVALLNSKGLLLKKETMNSEDQEKLKRPFFKVEEKKGKIHVSNPQIIEIIVNKSTAEIVSFHNLLITEKRLKLQFLSEEPDTQELVHFIYRIANSKYLWKSFAEWMCLGITTEEKIFNMFDFWNLGFKNICVGIIGHEIAFDKEGNVINLYLLSIAKKNGHLGEGTTLKKRFNEFVKLDKSIKKFIANEHIKNAQLPSLPPKFSPFGSKTSPKSRQIYFDFYIKELLKIQGINHCIKLLQFLGVDNELIGDEFYSFDESFSKSQAFDSMNIEELNMQKLK